MRVLAVDATSEYGSIALLEGDQVVEELAVLAPDGFAQLLFPAIQELLARHGWTLAQIGLFAAASGPGSFTGVRVGLTAVKGLAEALGRPAQAISNLRAIAGFGDAPCRMPLINARRGEMFAGLYDAALRPLEAERVGSVSVMLTGRPEGAQLIAQETWNDLSGVELLQAPRSLAAMVGKLASQAGGVDPAGLDANYVRRSDADGRWHDG